MLQLAEVHYVPGSTLSDDDSIVEQIQLLGYQAEFNEDDEPSTVTLVIHKSSLSLLSIDKVVDLLTKQPGVYQVRMRRNAASSSPSPSSPTRRQNISKKVYTLHVNYNLEITGPRTLLDVLSKAGIRANLPERMPIEDKTRQHQRRRLLLLLTCALFAIPTILIELAFPDSLREPTYKTIMSRDWLMLVLGTILQGFVWPFYVTTYRSLRYAKQVTMDALLALSTTVGYLFSVAGISITAITLGDIRLGMFFDMNAMLIVFFMLGRYLHHIGKHKAAHALSELKGLQTSTAHLVVMNDHQPAKSFKLTSNENTTITMCHTSETRLNMHLNSGELTTNLVDSSIAQIHTVDIRLVQRYDELVVFTGESIPLDGFVLDGSGDVDESLLTGEAMPVKKQSGARVVGGAKLVTGQLRLRVTKTSTEGTLADIGNLIESAQASKISVQKLTDRIASIFCPASIILALIVLFIWLGLTLSGVVTNTEGYPPVIFSLNFFIAILVVACPCAVSLGK
jgi:Cu+-exporting ATPase